MRKYLRPAVRYAHKAIPHPSAMRTFLIRRRTLAIPAAVSFLVVTAMSMMAVQGSVDDDLQNAKKYEYEKRAEGNSVSTSITTSNVPDLASKGSTKNTGPVSSVTVDNQTITVQPNGNYSKTIKNENGTTQINVSNNSTSTGSSVSSSISSTHLNVNSNTYTDSVNSNSP